MATIPKTTEYPMENGICVEFYHCPPNARGVPHTFDFRSCFYSPIHFGDVADEGKCVFLRAKVDGDIQQISIALGLGKFRRLERHCFLLRMHQIRYAFCWLVCIGIGLESV